MLRILLDTHVWLWMIESPGRMRESVRNELADRENELYLSAASCWEIAIKYRLGRLPLPAPPGEFIPPRMERDGVRSLPVGQYHALRVASLPDHHKDPFDRLLIAQSLIDNLVLYTADEQLLRYAAPCVLVDR
ncbi:MAG: type II toxin-antitoxin system VapC family toxin [Thermodesulfobacteriota bacterium]